MRFCYGSPPPVPDFHPIEEGWTALREPSPLLLNLIATPVGIAAAVLAALGWGITDARFQFTSDNPYAPLYFLGYVLAGFALLVLVHEMIHAFGYPRYGFTADTLIGVWPSKMLFYAVYLGELPRNRWLLVYLLPLLVITVLPIAVCRPLGLNQPILAAFSIANALFAGGDVTCFLLIIAQVPAAARMRNQGWNTFWKLSD
jgi:hypothetical protein